jgi:hypothetical protein
MKNLVWLVAFLFVAGTFQSCQKDIEDQPTDLVAPAIPPMAMFSMPTETFDENQVDTSGIANNPLERTLTGTYQNWFHSAVNLVVWHTVVVVNMAVPTAAFGAAINQPAEYIGDLTFAWDYVYVAPPNLGGKTYNVLLTGQYEPNLENVLWTMTVSEQGGFTDFVWYTGITSTTNDEGEFTLYRFPNNPQTYLRLDYAGDEVSGNGALRFTNIIPGHVDFGHYIEYREAPGSLLDRAFDVQREGDNFLQIQWNEAGNFGRVKHPTHFGDTDWHCWDAAFMDTEC